MLQFNPIQFNDKTSTTSPQAPFPTHLKRALPKNFLQFILHSLLLRLPTLALQIRHPHNLDDQARPAGEMLRALSLARLRVILLPGETRLFPALIHGVYDVLAELGVEGCSAGFVGAGGLRDVLWRMG